MSGDGIAYQQKKGMDSDSIESRLIKAMIGFRNVEWEFNSRKIMDY